MRRERRDEDGRVMMIMSLREQVKWGWHKSLGTGCGIWIAERAVGVYPRCSFMLK